MFSPACARTGHVARDSARGGVRAEMDPRQPLPWTPEVTGGDATGPIC